MSENGEISMAWPRVARVTGHHASRGARMTTIFREVEEVARRLQNVRRGWPGLSNLRKSAKSVDKKSSFVTYSFRDDVQVSEKKSSTDYADFRRFVKSAEMREETQGARTTG